MTVIELEDLAQEDVGDRVRFFRRERSMTQEQLGLAIGASTPQSAKATVAKIEKGQVPGGLRLQRIAAALRCSADILLSGTSRELFEVIRYAVRPRRKLEGAAYNAFRVGRIFLHFAFASGDCRPENAFVETANRLFYLAEHDPDGCRKLFAILPRGNPRQLLANRDLRELIRSAMHEQGNDPAAYVRYTFVTDAIALVQERYIPPREPVLPPTADAAATMGSGSAATGELQVIDYKTQGKGEAWPRVESVKAFPHSAALVRVAGDSMEPLARRGQYVVVAGAERSAQKGELVVCWSRSQGVLFKRLIEQDENRILLFDVSPSAYEPLALESDDVVVMRVITGVLFE